MIEPILEKSSVSTEQLPQKSRRPRKGRPPPDLRAVLDAILWKFSHQVAWYSLPTASPSWQTCYRYHRLWQSSGVMDQVYRTLYQDLVQRGGLDLPAALSAGSLSFDRRYGRWALNFDPAWQDTWQLETARLFLALAAKRLPRRRRKRSSSLLKHLGLAP